ncbi:MAG: urate hydroxylase PuuD [Burkholderiales bacterium]|nr:urate hydroxylase PuuD [Burkholderiales bacterium]
MEILHYGIGRWLHVMAGVMWVGLLYYFNFVQAAAMKDAQADGSAAGIAKHVAPRALLFFRWAAVVTWVAGMALLGDKADDAFLFRDRAYIPIGVGAWLGTIMFVNVWAIIWPNQRKILGLAPASEDEKARARRVAFLASRLNVVLSMPMLFFMTASGGLFRRAVFGA